MDGDGILLVALAVFAALAVVLLTTWGTRQRRAAGGSRLRPVPCCYRASAAQPWRPGRLRYDQDRLDHFGPGGLSMRPEHRWDRAVLDLGVARTLTDSCPGLPRGVRATAVTCRYGEDSFELALGHPHYTALRSWLESVPPGWNSNVA